MKEASYGLASTKLGQGLGAPIQGVELPVEVQTRGLHQPVATAIAKVPCVPFRIDLKHPKPAIADIANHVDTQDGQVRKRRVRSAAEIEQVCVVSENNPAAAPRRDHDDPVILR